MKTLPVLLIGALLLVAPLSAAAGSIFEQRCEKEMTPHFEVTSHEAGYTINNTVSSRLLNNRGTYTSVSQSMMGMTASHTRAEIDISGQSLTDKASGRECVVPRISVNLSYQPLDVYIAREFNPHSCPFRVVIEHELRHVQIYRDSLPRIEATIRRELLSRYAKRVFFAPVGEGVNALQDDIDSWLRPLIKAELAAVEELQRALDSPDEETRLSQSCQGQVASMMGSSF